MDLERKLIGQFIGRVRRISLSENAAYTSLVDQSDNEEYDVTFNLNELDPKIVTGDQLIYSIYKNSSGAVSIDVTITPNRALTNKDRGEIEALFS